MEHASCSFKGILFCCYFSCRAKKTFVIIFLCLIITVLAFRQCPALSALVACCLGLCLLAKLCLYFLVFIYLFFFFKSRYMFDLVLKINSILHISCSCQIIFILLLWHVQNYCTRNVTSSFDSKTAINSDVP